MGEGIHNKKQSHYNPKNDTEAGMTRDQRARVLNWENKHANDKAESVMFMDDKGNITSEHSQGEHGMVTHPWGAGYDKISTHNHPAPKGVSKGSLAMHIGSPLSPEDLDVAVKENQRIKRARSGNFIYSVERPKGGWDPKTSIPSQREVHHQALLHMGLLPAGSEDGVKIGDRYYKPDINNPRLKGFGTQDWYDREQRTSYAIFHQEMKKAAKKYGFTYTRRKAR